MMRPTIAFLSNDTSLTARLQAALGTLCTVMALDPRQEDGDAAIRSLAPRAVLLDAGAPAGARTVLERIAQVRIAFPDLPLVVIGDEMSAQLILASFRAGADDFLDREAGNTEIREAMAARLRETGRTGETGQAALVSVLSPGGGCDEDADLALNVASLVADARDDHRVLLLDLSLPVSPARTALGLDLNFTIADAIRDRSRLDRTFLESALTRVDGSGLYVLPLAGSDEETALPSLQDIVTLVTLMRALFSTVVVGWGAFSRAAAKNAAPGDHLLVCCNQRFSALRNARYLLEALARQDGLEPVLVIHQFDASLVPQPPDMIEALRPARSLTLRAGWSALAAAHNRGKPLALDAPSHYANALRTHLKQTGLLPHGEPDSATLKLLHWLHR